MKTKSTSNVDFQMDVNSKAFQDRIARINAAIIARDGKHLALNEGGYRNFGK